MDQPGRMGGLEKLRAPPLEIETLCDTSPLKHSFLLARSPPLPQ